MRLWVDDIRPAPSGWIWALNSATAISLLEMSKSTGRRYEVISLDHDLGGDDTTRPVVLWMCEHEWWPAEVRIHTANPVGFDWLNGMVGRYKS